MTQDGEVADIAGPSPGAGAEASSSGKLEESWEHWNDLSMYGTFVQMPQELPSVQIRIQSNRHGC